MGKSLEKHNKTDIRHNVKIQNIPKYIKQIESTLYIVPQRKHLIQMNSSRNSSKHLTKITQSLHKFSQRIETYFMMAGQP